MLACFLSRKRGSEEEEGCGGRPSSGSLSISFFLLYFLISCLSVEGSSPGRNSSFSSSHQFAALASISCSPDRSSSSSLLLNFPSVFLSSPSPSSSPSAFSSLRQEPLSFYPSSLTALSSRRSSPLTSFSPSLSFFSLSSSSFSGLRRPEEKGFPSSLPLFVSSVPSSSSFSPPDPALLFLSPTAFRSIKTKAHLHLPGEKRSSISEDRRKSYKAVFSTRVVASLLASCSSLSFIPSSLSSSSYRSPRTPCSLPSPPSSSSSSFSASSAPPCHHCERTASQSLHGIPSSPLLEGVSPSSSSSSILPCYASQHRFSSHSHALSSLKSLLTGKTILRQREDDRKNFIGSCSLYERERSYEDLSPSSVKAFSSLSVSFSRVREGNGEQVQDDTPCLFPLCLAERRSKHEDGYKKRKAEKALSIHLSVLSSSQSSGGNKDVRGAGEEKEDKKKEEHEEEGKTKNPKKKRKKKGTGEGQEEEEEGEGRTRDSNVDKALRELQEFFESVREKERRRRAFLKEKAEKVPQTLRSPYLDRAQVYLPHRYQHHRNPLRRRRVLRCFPPPRTRKFKLRLTPQEEDKEKKEETKLTGEGEEEQEQEDEEITFDPEDMDRFLDPPKPLSAYSWPEGCYLRIAYSGNRADDMDETGKQSNTAGRQAGVKTLLRERERRREKKASKEEEEEGERRWISQSF